MKPTSAVSLLLLAGCGAAADPALPIGSGAQRASDRALRDVGGCSDGPEVIDLTGRIYWTC